jgi:hypothetical protein
VEHPEEALRVEIDDPQSYCLGKPVGIIRGWLAAGVVKRGLSETLEFRVGGIAVPHRLVNRGDVEAMMEDHMIIGFEIPYDLSLYLPNIQNQCVAIRMKLVGYDPLFLRFQIAENALAICLAWAGGV